MIDQKICKAIGNKERMRIIICLEKEKSVSDLLGMCHISQSALSQHLKILKDARVLSSKREGKNMFYKTRDKKFIKIIRLLEK